MGSEMCIRDRYKEVLKKYLLQKKTGLCDSCKRRAEINVLRVLDCKREKCASLVLNAPKITDYHCRKCSDDYGLFKKVLNEMAVPFQEKAELVRGLDYYTGIVFEVIHPSLGAQDAIAAGGRYNNLIKEMGGPDIGATGYAIGIERLLLLSGGKDKTADIPRTIILPMDAKCRHEALHIAAKFWLKGIPCEVDHTERSFKGRMRRAHKETREFVIIIGENEIKNNCLMLKNMESKEQSSISFEEAVELVNGH